MLGLKHMHGLQGGCGILAVHVQDADTERPVERPGLLAGGIELQVAQARLDRFIGRFRAERDLEGQGSQTIRLGANRHAIVLERRA